MKKTLFLNSNLLDKLVSCNTYNTILDPDNISIEENLDYFCTSNKNSLYTFNFDKYKEKILEAISEILPKKIELSGIEIEFSLGNIYSPNEYNFKKDNVEIIVTLDVDKLYDIVKDDEAFDSFLNKEYSSYDGFMSFNPNSLKDWNNENDDDRKASTAINYLLQKNNFHKIDEYEIYNFMEYDITDFIVKTDL